ncbi:unnamed protein product [Clonostachys byssicola]|uniref:Zn(2)-C6 fungal-type domain-containing protein n=1 Tax=Clonostachys byssicola TaxID=160290 RepID=A0A9N9TUR5_9HYPO|nr:unnamed protein product [Clonostachys byssicola]
MGRRSASSKRAPKACLTCRRRKVRCDVSRRGQPCTNCDLDGTECVVCQRSSRRQQANTQEDHYALAASLIPLQSICVAEGFDEGNGHPATQQPDLLAADPTEYANLDHNQSSLHVAPDSVQELPPSVPISPLAVQDPEYETGSQSTTTDPSLADFEFLELSGLSNVPGQDIDYLVSQGAFRIPIRQVLWESMKQYFLYIHPLLPLVNEGDFWDMLRGHSKTTDHKMSFLVFRAMLFVSCDVCVTLLQSRNSE